MIIPDHLAKHCAAHPLCKGCPLKTCVMPLCEVTDPRWQAAVDQVARKVASL